MASEYVELVCEECPTCHMLFWISAKHDKRLRESKETFHCPSGHELSYNGKSDKQKLEESQKETKRIREYWDETCVERDKYYDDTIKLKRKVRKLKKDALLGADE